MAPLYSFCAHCGTTLQFLARTMAPFYSFGGFGASAIDTASQLTPVFWSTCSPIVRFYGEQDFAPIPNRHIAKTLKWIYN